MLQSMMNGLILGFVSSPTCPSNAEELRWGSRFGFRPALLVGLGAVIGDALVLLIVALGLYPLLQAFSSVQNALWIGGAAVLGWLAIGSVREAAGEDTTARARPGVQAEGAASPAGEPACAPAGEPGSPTHRPFLRGLLITSLNPVTFAWWVGLLAAAQAMSPAATVLFGAAVLGGSLLWFGALALLLHFGRPLLGALARRCLLLLSALVLFAYAGWLLLQPFS